MAFDHASGATGVETVLGLLVESSVVYCVLWVRYTTPDKSRILTTPQGVLTFVIIRNDRFPNTVTSYEIIAASYHYFAVSEDIFSGNMFANLERNAGHICDSGHSRARAAEDLRKLTRRLDDGVARNFLRCDACSSRA